MFGAGNDKTLRMKRISKPKINPNAGELIGFDVPSKPSKPQESGAPAALEAIAAHELRTRLSVDRIYNELQDAKASRNEDDDVSMRIYNRLHKDYLDALEEWNDARKSLLAFDKNVGVERREGEKVLVSEMKETFRQFMLSINLAIEQVIITDAQSVALCKTPQDFYAQHADNYRVAISAALDNAVRDNAVPKWMVTL